MSWTCFAVGWCPTDYVIWAGDGAGGYTAIFSNTDFNLGSTEGRPSVNADFMATSSSDWLISFPSATRNGAYWHSVRELKLFVCQQFYEVQATSCAVQPAVQYSLNSGLLAPTGTSGAVRELADISVAGGACPADGSMSSSVGYASAGGAIQFAQFTGFAITDPGSLGVPIDDATEYTVRMVVQLDESGTPTRRVLKLGGGGAGLFVDGGLEIRDSDGTVLEPDAPGPSVGVVPGEWTSIVVTAAPTGVVSVYQDGQRLGTWSFATSDTAWADGFRITGGSDMVLFNDYGSDCVSTDVLQAEWPQMSGGMLHSLQLFPTSLSEAQVVGLDECGLASEEYVLGSGAGCYGGSKPGLRAVSFNGVDKVVYCDPVTDG